MKGDEDWPWVSREMHVPAETNNVYFVMAPTRTDTDHRTIEKPMPSAPGDVLGFSPVPLEEDR